MNQWYPALTPKVQKKIEEVWAQPLANFFRDQAADKLFSAWHLL